MAFLFLKFLTFILLTRNSREKQINEKLRMLKTYILIFLQYND